MHFHVSIIGLLENKGVEALGDWRVKSKPCLSVHHLSYLKVFCFAEMLGVLKCYFLEAYSLICQISNILVHVLIQLKNKRDSLLKYADSGLLHV